MKGILKKYWKIGFGLLWLAFIAWLPFCLELIDEPEFLRGIGLFLLGIGVAPLGLYLAYKRTATLEVQTATEKEKNVTDAFAKSVELLGNEREAARQGGIYALGRIAKDNPELHPMIMDIIASYIRQESHGKFKDAYKEKHEDQTSEKASDKKDRAEQIIQSLRSEPVSMDIEAAVSVIRDRKTEYDRRPKEDGFFLDLSNAYLFNVDFSSTKLSKTNFSDSVMMRCIFDDTDLSGANFVGADLRESDFRRADLQGAELRKAKLTREQVNTMLVDEKTRLPDEFMPPS